MLESNGLAFQRESLSLPSLDAEGRVRDPAYDIVIIDEVSMVDAPLMEEMLRRIDFHKTRLILVGDHNQLPPVGAGNILRDVLNTGWFRYSFWMRSFDRPAFSRPIARQFFHSDSCQPLWRSRVERYRFTQRTDADSGLPS